MPSVHQHPGSTGPQDKKDEDKYDLDKDGKISKKEFDKIPPEQQDQYQEDPPGSGNYKKKAE
jgi:hypothetical protein